jgi:hypothetical protein
MCGATFRFQNIAGVELPYVRRSVPAHDVDVHVQSSTSLQHVLCDSINCSQAPPGHPRVSTGCRKGAGWSTGHTRKRTYETNAASQDEEPIEVAHPDDVLNLFLCTHRGRERSGHGSIAATMRGLKLAGNKCNSCISVACEFHDHHLREHGGRVQQVQEKSPNAAVHLQCSSRTVNIARCA